MASGDIQKSLPFIYFRDKSGTNTFTTSLLSDDTSGYKCGLLMDADPWSPNIWLITCTQQSTPTTIKASKVFGTGKDISSIAINDLVLTITFNATVYGGIRLLWFS